MTIFNTAKDCKLEDAVRRFVGSFHNIPAGLISDLIEAKEGYKSYDSDILRIVAGGSLECPECGSDCVEDQDVATDPNGEVIKDNTNTPFRSIPPIPDLEGLSDEALAEKREIFYDRHGADLSAFVDAKLVARKVCESCGHSGNPDEKNEGFYTRGSQYAFPCAWGTLFHDADLWLSGRPELAAEAGFIVFESDYFDGYLLGVDGAGYNFYEHHWLPLYEGCGILWHEIS